MLLKHQLAKSNVTNTIHKYRLAVITLDFFSNTTIFVAKYLRFVLKSENAKKHKLIIYTTVSSTEPLLISLKCSHLILSLRYKTGKKNYNVVIYF